MRKQGNRNFGVWNPPTGMDSVRRSAEVDFDLIVRLNNSLQNKELGISQEFLDFNQKFPNQFTQVAFEYKIFDKMIQQGWGGIGLPSTSSSLPTPTPTPSSSTTSFPSLPLGDLGAGRIDRAMQWNVCPSFCVDFYSLQAGGPTAIHRVCWQLGKWRSVPPSSTASASWNTGFIKLYSWYRAFDSSVPWDTSNDYFIVDQATRNSCFPMISSTPLSTLPPKDFDASDVDAAMSLW